MDEADQYAEHPELQREIDGFHPDVRFQWKGQDLRRFHQLGMIGRHLPHEPVVANVVR